MVTILKRVVLYTWIDEAVYQWSGDCLSIELKHISYVARASI
jgi:hypothetical protein